MAGRDDVCRRARRAATLRRRRRLSARGRRRPRARRRAASVPETPEAGRSASGARSTTRSSAGGGTRWPARRDAAERARLSRVAYRRRRCRARRASRAVTLRAALARRGRRRPRRRAWSRAARRRCAVTGDGTGGRNQEFALACADGAGGVGGAGGAGERRHRRHRRPDRRGRRPSSTPRRSTRAAAAGLAAGVSRRQRLLRFFDALGDLIRPVPPARTSATFRYILLAVIFNDVFTRSGSRADARPGSPSRRHARAAATPQDPARRAHVVQAPVKSLVASGDLIQIRGHRFGLPEKMDLYVGRLQTHPAGFGFVVPERPLDAAAATSTSPART